MHPLTCERSIETTFRALALSDIERYALQSPRLFTPIFFL